MQPEEAKRFEVEKHEMNVFRKGRSIKNFTKDTRFFSLEDLTLESNDAIQIKVITIKQPFVGDELKVTLSNPRIAFFVE